MTAFLPGLIVGFALGIFSILILAALYLLHRPRYVAPTKYRRQWRDALPEVRNEPPPMPVCKPAREAEIGGIEYRFMGQTGEEV
jgi:hypothetical protein